MAQFNTDWFTTTFSNDELAVILSDYSKDVFGQRTYLPKSAGRCSLVNELELIDAAVKAMTPAQRKALHFTSELA